MSFCQSHTKRVKFENLLLSKFYNPVTYIYCELSQNKTDNLCLDISGFVVVLSFGDLERVDQVFRPNFKPRAAGYFSILVRKRINTPFLFAYAKGFLAE